MLGNREAAISDYEKVLELLDLEQDDPLRKHIEENVEALKDDTAQPFPTLDIPDRDRIYLQVNSIQIFGDNFDDNGVGTFSTHMLIHDGVGWGYATFPYPGSYYEKKAGEPIRLNERPIEIVIEDDSVAYIVFLVINEDRNNMDEERIINLMSGARAVIFETISAGEEVPETNLASFFSVKLSDELSSEWAEVRLAGELVLKLSPENNWMKDRTLTGKSADENMLMNISIFSD